jgi:hypothetical protein
MGRKATHGDSLRGNRTAEYNAWRTMNKRCSNPNRPQWKDWGGRGIKVCERWRKSYLAFLTDMGRKPSPELSLDRIDNDGNYEPGNCRWTTRLQQNQNRRCVRQKDCIT